MQTSEKIKQARKKAGLTQEELALKLGVSQAMISAYEKGLRNPKWETIRSIANALGVSVVEIASDLDNLSKELARKEIRRHIKEIDGSTEFSTTEKEKKSQNFKIYIFLLVKDFIKMKKRISKSSVTPSFL